MNGVFMNGVSTIIFSRISFSYIIILFIGYTLRFTSVLTIVNIFFSRKNKWAPGFKVGSSTKIFSYKNASLFFFECNNSWATYFISNFFFSSINYHLLNFYELKPSMKIIKINLTSFSFIKKKIHIIFFFFKSVMYKE